MQEIKRVQPEGPYRIIGYSYGACISLELAIGLQERSPSQPNIVESLILLDGSHHYMQTYRKVWREYYKIGDNALVDEYLKVFETEVLASFTMRLVPIDHELLRKELFALPNYRARINYVVQKAMSSGLPIKPEDMQFAAESIVKKIIAADK